MTYTELKRQLLDAALFSLERGASLTDVLLEAYELGTRSGDMPEEEK